jgi:hypothetical protein
VRKVVITGVLGDVTIAEKPLDMKILAAFVF